MAVITGTHGVIQDPDIASHWQWGELREDEKCTIVHPGTVDFRDLAGERHNQRNTNSCVGQAFATACEVQLGGDQVSTRSIYYLAREIMSPPRHHQDGGSSCWAGAEALRRFGWIPDLMHPWDEDKINESPSPRAMRQGERILAYYVVVGPDEALDCLRRGLPVILACYTDSRWYRYQGGYLGPVISPNGHHASVLVGWDGASFLGVNSWGRHWGVDGCYRVTPGVLEARGSECWVVVV